MTITSAKVEFAPEPLSDGQPRSIDEVETVLSLWFCAPVILTSSGRSALSLAMRHLGLNRYRSTLSMPQKTSACVFEAVIRHAFPISSSSSDAKKCDATLLIHQYGHLQSYRPSGPVIEDICHNFFASAATGARDWAGDYAIFSLPKFFRMAGMAGGLVVPNTQQAAQIRALRDQFPDRDPNENGADRLALQQKSAGLPLAQFRALLNAKPDEIAVSQFPRSLDDIAAIGARRQRITSQILEAIDQDWLDPNWKHMCYSNLPFALPIFAPPQILKSIAEKLAVFLADTSIYGIDRNRDVTNSDNCETLLLPVNDCIDGQIVALVIQSLRNHCE